MKPYFLISIDAEGDDLWSRPREIKTENSGFLPRFQELCDSYSFPVTYLTNYEMAMDRGYQEFALDLVRRGVGEIGMHLHAWNNPPLFDLTGDDLRNQPYLIEYPKNVQREKIKLITNLLQETFNSEIVSHRAGRWAVDSGYIHTLADFNYRVDCSVTPGISWKKNLGNPVGSGGADYRRFPQFAYWIRPGSPSKPAKPKLLEVPMTTSTTPRSWESRELGIQSLGYYAQLLRAFSVKQVGLFRPNGSNRQTLIATLRQALEEKWPYVQFMLHSSELMPGGSPTFQDRDSIEKLYDDIATTLDFATGKFRGITHSEYLEVFQ